MRKPFVIAGLAVFLSFALVGAAELTDEEQLGKSIFFDQNLSLERNQACAACHAPDYGFTGPIPEINAHGAVYEGSIPGRFGNRKPPSAAYATTSPIFGLEMDKKDFLFEGGNFWDGRATGEKLGNPAADQAQGPFLNPAEQALPDNACVVHRVCNPTVPADYPVSFTDVWGMSACNIMWPPDVDMQCSMEGGEVMLSDADRDKVDDAYDWLAISIKDYEASPEVNAYSSKFDAVMAGMASFTKEEKMGFNLFKGKGKCDLCHVLDDMDEGGPPLFTDYTFDNLGVPINPENPAFVADPDYRDLGLGGFLAMQGELWSDLVEENLGKQKVPTLRNVAKAPGADTTKAFTHNGYFKSLWEVVHFYNTRDAKPACEEDYLTAAEAIAADCWPEPEVEENVNDSELGDLHMSEHQEELIVEFLKTLDDGWVPE